MSSGEEKIKAAFELLDGLTAKTVHFDLNKQKLIEATGKTDTREAYASIGGILKGLHYDHFQYSGYKTKGPKPCYQVMKDFKELNSRLPWFFDVCEKCHMTFIVGPMFDMKSYFLSTMAYEDRAPESVVIDIDITDLMDTTNLDEHAMLNRFSEDHNL